MEGLASQIPAEMGEYVQSRLMDNRSAMPGSLLIWRLARSAISGRLYLLDQ